LHFRGRYKEIVITGGENVFPIEVERVIADHPSIVDVAVYGVDDDTWGERVEAAVVVRPQTSVTIDEVRDFCRSRLAGFKIPRSLVIYDDLPLTPNSKVDKRRLSEASRGRRDP
jgi:fatty-acyl-CoA synthase